MAIFHSKLFVYHRVVHQIKRLNMAFHHSFLGRPRIIQYLEVANNKYNNTEAPTTPIYYGCIMFYTHF